MFPIGNFRQGSEVEYPIGFTTKWTVGAGISITLPLTNNGTFNCVVNWGDGNSSTILTYNSANITHTYTLAGTYIVEITGECPGWSFANAGSKLLITEVVNWGNSIGFGGFSYLKNGFGGCSNLIINQTATSIIAKSDLTDLSSLFYVCNKVHTVSSLIFTNCVNVVSFNGTFRLSGFSLIPPDLFKYNVKATIFDNIFYCPVSNIPSDLFKYNVDITVFVQTFFGSKITSIPVDLFKYNTSVTTFYGVFGACPLLLDIPSDLFKYNTSVTDFSTVFGSCLSLLQIPNGIFQYNTLATKMTSAFASCTSLIDIPVDTFRYNPLTVSGTTNGACAYIFSGCTALEVLPQDLFKYNTEVLAFYGTFANCPNITSIPDYFFRYNVNALNWDGTFKNDSRLVLSSNIFCDEVTEASTRFAGKVIYLGNAFYRLSYYHQWKGIAPTLWTYTFSTVTSSGCFGDVGNSATSLTNYASITAGWK